MKTHRFVKMPQNKCKFKKSMLHVSSTRNFKPETSGHVVRSSTEIVDSTPQLEHRSADLYLEYRKDSSASEDSTEHDSWDLPFVEPNTMIVQQSESTQTGSQLGFTNYIAPYSGLHLVPPHDPGGWKWVLERCVEKCAIDLHLQMSILIWSGLSNS